MSDQDPKNAPPPPPPPPDPAPVNPYPPDPLFDNFVKKSEDPPGLYTAVQVPEIQRQQGPTEQK